MPARFKIRRNPFMIIFSVCSSPSLKLQLSSRMSLKSEKLQIMIMLFFCPKSFRVSGCLEDGLSFNTV